MKTLTIAIAYLAGLVLLSGCEKHAQQGARASKQASKPESGHAHPHEGPHGGCLGEWGDEEFHVEFTVDHKTKTVVVYVLDDSAKLAPKLDAAKITKMMLTVSNVQPPVTLELKPDAAKTDAKGIAFTATHDAFAKEMEFKGNISGLVDGKPYSGDFKETAHDGHDHDKKKAELEDHPGGVHVAFAQGKHYAEAVLHKGGSLHLFLFSKDLSRVVEADAQAATAYVRAIGTKEFVTFELKPEPLPGDVKGYTSRFAGDLPADLQGKDLEISIPALKLGGERYHLAFQTVEKPHGSAASHAADAMPAKVEDDSERKLYLTPGGIYSAADIQANGNVTASQRFKDFKASHDINPKSGDKICPVTLTKANPACSWIVGGKKYEFCCPPCVDEFVKLAKEDPNAVKEPENYVKK